LTINEIGGLLFNKRRDKKSFSIELIISQQEKFVDYFITYPLSGLLELRYLYESRLTGGHKGLPDTQMKMIGLFSRFRRNGYGAIKFIQAQHKKTEDQEKCGRFD